MTDDMEDRATVWKYTLPAVQETVIRMPRSARILRVDFQGHDLQLWALVDPEMPRVERRFALRGTGQEAALLWWETYLGTAIHPTSDLVVHVWERVGAGMDSVLGKGTTGGIVPPHITDQIPGHEGDQPGEGHDH